MTRPPPSLLPGSDGTRSPGFNWYYEAATTTGRFLRHSVCSVAPQYLGSISNFRSSSRGNRRANARVLFDRCHPLLPVLCPKDAFGSPKFPANPSCICPVLRLRPGLHARLSRRFSVVLAQQEGEDPGDSSLSKLNRTAFALAVYASCRPLGRRRKTRFRWLANLSGWAFSYPLSSFGEFLLSLPLSQDLSWRDLLLILL